MEPKLTSNSTPVTQKEQPGLRTLGLTPAHFVLGLLGLCTIILITYATTQWIGQEPIAEFVRKAGVFGPLAIILLKSITVVWIPFSGAPLYPLVSVLYGNVVGTFYIVMADLLGACIAFWLARRFGTRLIAKLFGEKTTERIRTLAQGGDWRTFLLMRVLLPPLIQEAINYAGGLLRISFWQFLVISAISFIPYTFVFVAFGTILGASALGQILYGAGVALYVVIILVALYRYWR